MGSITTVKPVPEEPRRTSGPAFIEDVLNYYSKRPFVSLRFNKVCEALGLTRVQGDQAHKALKAQGWLRLVSWEHGGVYRFNDKDAAHEPQQPTPIRQEQPPPLPPKAEEPAKQSDDTAATTMSRQELLTFITEFGPVSIKQIAEFFDRKPNTVQHAVMKAEAAGVMFTKTLGIDRRTLLYALPTITKPEAKPETKPQAPAPKVVVEQPTRVVSVEAPKELSVSKFVVLGLYERIKNNEKLNTFELQALRLALGIEEKEPN